MADIQPFYYTVFFFFLQLVFVKCLSIILCNQHINTYLPSTSTSPSTLSYILLLKPLPSTLFLLHTKHIICTKYYTCTLWYVTHSTSPYPFIYSFNLFPSIYVWNIEEPSQRHFILWVFFLRWWCNSSSPYVCEVAWHPLHFLACLSFLFKGDFFLFYSIFICKMFMFTHILFAMWCQRIS